MPYQILVEQKPSRYPATCSSCGAASLAPRDWWIDTGCDERGDLSVFAIIFCSMCFDNLATAAGYVKRGEEVQYYLDELDRLRTQVKELESIRDTLDALGIDSDRIGKLSHLTQMDDPATSDREETVDARANGVTESSDDENMGKLHPSSDDKFSISI